MVIYIYILLYTFIYYLYSQWICKCYALEHSTPEPAFCIEANWNWTPWFLESWPHKRDVDDDNPTHTKCKPKATRAAFRVEECLGASKLSEPSASKLSGLLSGSCLRYVKVLASRSFCIWNGISWCYPMAVSSRLGHPRITLTYTSIIYLWLAEKSVASAIKSLGLPDLKQPREWNMIPVIESISTFICEIGEILHCPGFFVPRYARPTIP